MNLQAGMGIGGCRYRYIERNRLGNDPFNLVFSIACLGVVDVTRSCICHLY